jgi:hypothetical protein
LIVFVLPFHDQFIELQPGGKNLGKVSVLGYRILFFMFGGLPLWILAFAVRISRRRLHSPTITPWKTVAISFAVCLILIAWLWRDFHILNKGAQI